MGEHYRTAAKTVATGADQTLPLPKTGSVAGKLHFGNITGLTCTIQASYDKLEVGNASKVYTNIDTYTSTGVKYAAGATVTTADDMDLLFFARGVDTVKVTYVGGTNGPVYVTMCDDGSELVAAMLATLLAGGGAASASPPASTPYHLIVDGTDELLISASARRLTAAGLFSLNDAPVYAKFYDKATAPSESDTPILVIGSPANSTAANGAGNNARIPDGGIALTNGLGIRVVKGLADNSDTAADSAENVAYAAYRTS